MLITHQSPRGGRPTLKHTFPLAQDKQGNFGIRLGYLETGEPVLIRLSDAEDFGNQFACTTKTFGSGWGRGFDKFGWVVYTIDTMTTSNEIKEWIRKQASKGGKETVRRYGSQHMSNIVKRRWEKYRKDQALDKNK